MKYLISLLLIALGCVGIYAQPSNDSLANAAALVDGLFFDKSTPTKSIIPENPTMVVPKDPDGAMVIGVYLPEGFVLEESVK